MDGGSCYCEEQNDDTFRQMHDGVFPISSFVSIERTQGHPQQEEISTGTTAPRIGIFL